MDAGNEGNTEEKPPLKVVSPARSGSGSGNRLIWLAIVVAVGMILAYAAGLLR